MTSPQLPDPVPDRPRFTSRAAVLIVVVCAIALSLAYPVREYIAQLHQISQLRVQQAQIAGQVRRLQAQRQDLGSPAYVEQQARARLHMCFPAQTCYVIIGNSRPAARTAAGPAAVTPWYERLWTSVHQADQ
jgi:cell division protein FtsB